jgi:capsular exopolysaccharide synthesis family protein
MLRTTHVRIVDRAVLPQYPVSPNNTLNAIGGTLGGLALGILIIVAMRFLDRRLRSPEAVEEMGVTILGVVPRLEGRKEGGSKRRARRLEAVDETELFVHAHPMSTAAECCRTLRTNLMFMSVGAKTAKVFVVTSTNPREGKTTVASNLAASIAQSGKRVLLVDTDLRRPRVHAVFGISKDPGVTSVVVGATDLKSCVVASEVPGLFVLPAGPVPPNPSELLHSPRFHELLERARQEYDCVIFDSPPLGAVTDAAILSPQVDGTIVVVQAGQTTRDALRSTIRQLNDVGAKILGAVLNNLDISSAEYGQGYYYRRYGEYYASDDVDSAAAE